MRLVDNHTGKTVYSDVNHQHKLNSMQFQTSYGRGVHLPDFMTKDGKFKGRPVVQLSEDDFSEALIDFVNYKFPGKYKVEEQ